MLERIKHFEDKIHYELDSWDHDEALKSDEKVTVTDTRSAAAYVKGYIPGALTLPHRDMNNKTNAELNRDTVYITNCDE
ncbi:rhodanese-like domain-containing protein [Pseudodesulfovibrio piezophilus]|uniref:Rhodanese domain protein n=1 Tax=Pseudodesulfovibrio piezophilus (strain DSM 21447 / JCM 15486 / C1TLV30) TaxID=1322246 RepID=M1WJJ9_PSEP2